MKRTNISNFLALGSIFLYGGAAFAGVGSHGGEIVKCPGQPYVILDYYQASLPRISGSITPLLDVDSLGRDGVLQKIEERLDQVFPDLADRFRVARKTLGPVSQWIASGANRTWDSNLAYPLCPGGFTIQAASRQNSTVFANPTAIDLITNGQTGVLASHEILYYMTGADTSEGARKVLQDLLEKDLDISRLTQDIYDAHLETAKAPASSANSPSFTLELAQGDFGLGSVMSLDDLTGTWKLVGIATVPGQPDRGVRDAYDPNGINTGTLVFTSQGSQTDFNGNSYTAETAQFAYDAAPTDVVLRQDSPATAHFSNKYYNSNNSTSQTRLNYACRIIDNSKQKMICQISLTFDPADARFHDGLSTWDGKILYYFGLSKITPAQP